MNFCPGSKNSFIGERKKRKPEDMTELSTNYQNEL
jgi:ribosomal protein S18